MNRPGRPKESIVGIDFSGATDAGRKIWIAQGRVAAGRLHIESCASACDLQGCTADPVSACAALVGFLRELGPAVVGCDFPFSIPARMIEQQDWPAFIAAFGEAYPTAEYFHRRTHRRWGEARRACDAAARTPFAPNNLRLYRQTYHGIRDVLAPLVAADAVRVVPLQQARRDRPALLECCPASALKQLGLSRPYKGRGALLRVARLTLLAAFERRGLARLPRNLRAEVVEQPGGDALDSVIAAWIAYRAGLTGLRTLAPKEWSAIEGYVYYGQEPAATVVER